MTNHFNKVVANYRFPVNIHFATQALINEKIASTINELNDGRTEIIVAENDYESAIKILDALNLDDSISIEENEHPIQDYEEWVNNQYNPGYFTGGKIPGWMLGKGYKKFLAGYFILYAVIFGYEFFIKDSVVSTSDIIVLLIYLAIGIILFIQLKLKRKSHASKDRSY